MAERQQNRKTTELNSNMGKYGTHDIGNTENRTERPQDTETTGQKDNRIGRKQHRKTTGQTNTDNSRGRQQGRKRYVLLYFSQ